MSPSDKKQLHATIAALPARFRLDRPKRFDLAGVEPGETAELPEKRAEAALEATVERIGELQEMLYAQRRWSVLVLLQAMDAGGKDSIVEHVFAGVQPAGVQVFGFLAPSAEEREHDFLWRHATRLPMRGRIGIHVRTWYEEVLIARVRPEVLAGQLLPPALVTKNIWRERFESINALEQHLARNGTIVMKFFLHISPEEQRERFLARLEEPSKRWKFNAADLADRRHWDDYMRAYKKLLRHTSTRAAPWHVVPADHKWFARLVVATAVAARMERLALHYPKFEGARERELQKARRVLLAERKKR